MEFFHFIIFSIKGKKLYCLPPNPHHCFSSWLLEAISVLVWSNSMSEERCSFYTGKEGNKTDRETDKIRTYTETQRNKDKKNTKKSRGKKLDMTKNKVDLWKQCPISLFFFYVNIFNCYALIYSLRISYNIFYHILPLLHLPTQFISFYWK